MIQIPSRKAVLPSRDDDSVEIFLGPFPDDADYYQFLINCRGDHIIIEYGQAPKFSDAIQVTAETSDECWSLNIAIPWRGLGVRPEAGESWGFNLARNKKTAPTEMCIWRWTGESYLAPERFGKLTFLAV